MKRALIVSFCLGLAVSCTRLDTLPGAYYPCHRDGGSAAECPGEWHCGLEDRCLPNQPGAWACRGESDCYGWHCGAQGTCYALDGAQAVPCRPDGGDCAPGWRCGVPVAAAQLSVCHDTSVAAPYTCRDDTDCEQAWRCGPDGVCLDTATEALRPNATIVVAHETAEAPLWNLKPSLLAISEDGWTPETACVLPYQRAIVADVVAGGTFIHVSWYHGGVATCADAGPSVLMGSTNIAPIGGLAPSALLSLGDEALAVGADGGVFSLRFDGGVLVIQREPVPFAPARLKNGLRPGVAFAFDATRLARRESGTWQETDLTAFDAGVLNDVGEFGDRYQSVDPAVILGTGTGLFRLTPGALIPTYAPIAGCPTENTAPLPVYRVAQTDRSGQHGLVVSGGSGSTALNLIELRQGSWPYPSSCEVIGSSLGEVGTLNALTEVPSGNLHFTIGDDGHQTYQTFLIARQVPGEPLETRLIVGGSGPLESAVLIKDLSEYGTTVSFGHPRLTAFADELGHVWLSWQGRLFPMTAILLPRAPLGLVSHDPLFAFTPDVASPKPWPLDVAAGYALMPDAGFFHVGARLRSAVSAAPDWAVLDLEPAGPTAVVDLWEVLRNPPSSDLRAIAVWPDIAEPPVLAARQPLPDGGTLVLGTAGDLILAVDVTDRLAGRATKPTLRPSLVPLSRGGVTSLAVLATRPAGASYAHGYVVANGRLFRFRADNPVVWKADELDLGSAEAAVVWTDRERGRVALRDGAVFSLPSRVQLAPPFAEASSLIDLVDRCGHIFALANGALYRLESDGSSPMGVWVRLNVDATAAELSGGKLQNDAQGVHLVSAAGRHEIFHADCVP
ncbi:MAG: hypothetical protein AMXMBFR34_38360 [Myxococcaceae bacterium]